MYFNFDVFFYFFMFLCLFSIFFYLGKNCFLRLGRLNVCFYIVFWGLWGFNLGMFVFRVNDFVFEFGIDIGSFM